jgi:carboxyl-terminal processing protease
MLRIQRSGVPEELEMGIDRAVITVDSLLGERRREDGTWDFRLAEDPRIGYLRLTSFGKHTAEELGRALGDGHGCPFDAIVLDIRNNAGGLLDSAVETCDLFLDGGRIVSTRGRDGADRSVAHARDSTVIPSSIPMVVLINRHSASASEILAACLQDHGRALVVGERSYGKGTVQNLFKLEGGHSALKLTTATYWRPSGKNIHRRENAPVNEDWGVRPDAGFEVVLTDEQMEAVFRARRDRDLGRSPSASGPSTGRTAAPLENHDRSLHPSLPQSAVDVVPRGSTQDESAEVPEPALSSSEDAARPAPPADDAQLRRAVDYLHQKLKVNPRRN